MRAAKQTKPVNRIPLAPIALVIVACLFAWWLWPAKPLQPERLSGDVVEVLFEGGKLPDGTIVTQIGHPLAPSALEAIQTKVLRGRLAGYEIEDIKKDSIRSSARSAATLKKKDGTRRYVSIVSWRAPKGAIVTLGQVMNVAWTLDERKDGFKPLDRAKNAQLCLAGIEKDRPVLESLGIDGMDGDDGHFRNWDELIDFYRSVVIQG